MECLSCGDCCKRMSPFGNPCPHLVEVGDVVFCSIYNKRPEECRNHSFPSRYCPIGFDVLGLRNPQDVAIRIDKAWNVITNNKPLAQTKERMR